MEPESNVQPIKSKETITKEEAYLREQKLAIESIKVGKECPSGCIVKKIYARGDEHVIYEIDSINSIESIRVYIHTKIEDDITPLSNFQKVKDRFDKAKSSIFKYSANSSYKQRAASALVTAIMGDVDEANKIFDNIESDAKEDFQQRVYGRIFYLLGAIVLGALICTSALLAHVWRGSEFFTSNYILLHFLYAAAYASAGGFFSVSLKAKDVWAQQAINNWMYAIYGAERLIISAIAGVITYTTIKSGLIFSFIETSDSAAYLMLSICFLSGFSESLIPNYMGKLEKEA